MPTHIISSISGSKFFEVLNFSIGVENLDHEVVYYVCVVVMCVLAGVGVMFCVSVRMCYSIVVGYV